MKLAFAAFALAGCVDQSPQMTIHVNDGAYLIGEIDVDAPVEFRLVRWDGVEELVASGCGPLLTARLDVDGMQCDKAPGLLAMPEISSLRALPASLEAAGIQSRLLALLPAELSE